MCRTQTGGVQQAKSPLLLKWPTQRKRMLVTSAPPLGYLLSTTHSKDVMFLWVTQYHAARVDSNSSIHEYHDDLHCLIRALIGFDFFCFLDYFSQLYLMQALWSPNCIARSAHIPVCALALAEMSVLSHNWCPLSFVILYHLLWNYAQFTV